MFKQIKERIEFYDWPSIWKTVGLLLFLSFALLFFFNFAYLKMLWLGRDMPYQTTGVLIARKSVYGMNQSLTGTSTKINSIKFYYKFDLNGRETLDSCNVEYSLQSAQQLNRLKDKPLPLPVEIKYQIKPFFKSMVWVR
ncbi:hypothetical protein [Pedobacter montanisoli]|uniref:DUF3592 domain-containing protein n=1 Tax=Pedobacter montanisoli TaxID=2923277 RepID=A0ABS9ZS26_9SPHI|nr:hypothetical protein [Pedobacter montanisoli]MCJ0741370.1 hypothetical protein [Pedobacter montanisoli]